MHFLTNQWPKHAFKFLGGGGGQQAQQIQAAPVPLAAPPVSPNSTAVMQAEHDVAQANLLKKSVKKTIFAGDTGGFGAAPNGAPGSPNPKGGKF